MSAAEPTYRLEEPGDAAGIFAVHAASFPTEAEARLVDALRGAGRLALSVVAVEGEPGAERIVGHAGFSPVTVDGAARGGIGLAPVAVLPDRRRRGIAERLVNEGLERCARAGWRFAVVLGSPRYYGRFGFEAARGWGLVDDFEGGDAFQALELVPGSIPRGGGGVAYAPEFSAL